MTSTPSSGKSVNWQDDPSAFERLPESEKRLLLDWISEALEPTAKSEPGPKSSYKLKHYYQAAHVYVTNGVMKGALLASGYTAADREHKNWNFDAKLKDPNAARVA